MKKNNKKYFLYLTLALLLFCSFFRDVIGVSDKHKIEIDTYNNLIITIDSIGVSIEKHRREMGLVAMDIDTCKREKQDLIASEEALRRVLKEDYSRMRKDSLSTASKNLAAIQMKIQKIDSNILKLGLTQAKHRSEVEKLKRIEDEEKRNLADEIRRIRDKVKNLSGSFKIRFNDADYHFYISNSDSDAIKMHLLDQDGLNYTNIRNLHAYLISQKQCPLMITNAGMYTNNLQPQGLFIEKRKEIRALDLRSPETDANFYLKPNGVFYIDTLGKAHVDSSEEFQMKRLSRTIHVDYATQSGPMLVINGKLNAAFKSGSSNIKIRSGVGIIDSRRTVFAISLVEVNFYNFSLLFKDIFGCSDALFLDGAISLMFLKDISPHKLGGQFGPLISVTAK